MNTKQNRLIKVYEYLRENHGIHTQGDFASAIKCSRNAASLALNGNEMYLTNNLFQKISNAFPGTFNIDWLLTGEGEMLISPEPKPKKENRDYLAELIAAKDETIAAKDEVIASLKAEIDALRLVVKQQQIQIEAERPKPYPSIADLPTPVAAEKPENP